MERAAITYEEFINELRTSCSTEPGVLALINKGGEGMLNGLLGIVDSFTSENKYYEAEKILTVLANAFNEPEFYSALALSQKKQNKLCEAKENYERSLSLDPSLFKIYYNYGILLYEMKDYEEAIEAFEESIRLNGGCAYCFYNLGNCCRETGNFEKAKEAYKNVLKVKPGYEDAVYNLGVVEEYLGNTEAALDKYNEAIELNYNNVQAHWNRALLILQHGNYKEGFKEYEWRLKKKEFQRSFSFPLWKGENIEGKKLLIYCEQGFGDAIQFARFIKLINAKYIALECRKELKELFESFDFIDEVISRNSRIYHKSEFDYAVSIMSLPFILKIELKDIADEKYIKAGKNKSVEWRAKINANDKLKIGIVCSGNPQHQNDKYRSINPELLLANLVDDNSEIYSLQINADEKTKQIFAKYNVVDLTENIKNFLDTAAFINNLDLIITVDTSAAHLAGAMGKETWVLLPFNPDWRWLLNRADSPWYSSVKLFRQKNKNDWGEVLQNVKLNLDKKLLPETNAITDDFKINLDKYYSEIENYINADQLDKALVEIESVLANDPLPYKAFNYLGILFSKTKNYVKAEEYFLKTISLKPDFIDALSNLGIIYFEQDMFEDSMNLHKKAIVLNDKNPKAYFNLAYALQELGEIEQSIENYKKAIELNTRYPDAQFNLALLNLLTGNYQKTWKAYNDWAFLSGSRTIRNVIKPQWSGENFSGKKLYIYPDQGMGDVIQLVRYLPFVKERGGEVIFECQPALYDLLKNINGFNKIVKTNQDLKITEEYDLQLPLQNLPEIFNTSLDTIPNYSAPLKASGETNQKWENKIGKSKNYKIGFVWTGNPYPPINKKRHASLNDFIPLFELSGIDFYSLQIGEEAGQLKYYKPRFNIFDLTGDIKNFEDTAAIINNLDLVVTIDTSVAHLAGAMDKKVFTLLPFIPDWRWGLTSSSTPWYPSMKLFRQNKRGNWEEPVTNIKEEVLKIKKEN